MLLGPLDAVNIGPDPGLTWTPARCRPTPPPRRPGRMCSRGPSTWPRSYWAWSWWSSWWWSACPPGAPAPWPSSSINPNKNFKTCPFALSIYNLSYKWGMCSQLPLWGCSWSTGDKRTSSRRPPWRLPLSCTLDWTLINLVCLDVYFLLWYQLSVFNSLI